MPARIALLVAALLVVTSARPACGAEQLSSGLRYPSLSQDGTQVAFSYRGDVWIAPVDAKGVARRLTLHVAQETLPRISPDGQTIAFVSARNGNYDIFTLPVTGGMPERVTFNGAYELLCSWSPDGKRLLFASVQGVGVYGMDLYEADLELGGTPRRITFDGGRDGSYSPDGKWIVYARGFNEIYQDNYEGSANYELYIVDAAGGEPRRLTDTPGNERFPYFSADGKSIYFVAEEKGNANFYAMPVEGGARTQLTQYTGKDVHRPCLGWDFRTVVFEVAGQLHTADLAQPSPKAAKIPLAIRSDVRSSGVERRTITSGGEQVNISPDGRQAAFTLRGDIWVMPASGGTGRRITSSPANEQWPRFSPDGKQLAYFSNASGNNDIYVHDLGSGATRRVTDHMADDFFHNWSPDGRTLVFTSERSGNKEIWLLDLESGQTTQLTRNDVADDDPIFSPDGRQIAFDSGREGSQAIYVMDRDGTNVRRVTQQTGFLQVPGFSPDGRFLVYESYNPATGRSGGLFVTSVSGGPSVQVSRDGQTACWPLLGDYIYFTADRGGENSGVFRVRAPASIDVGERVPFVGTVQVDLREELGNLFDEIWNALKEGFYDPKMHGVDWDAMRTKYRDMAIEGETKDEFQTIVRQMLAELGASHLGIMGGQRPGNSVLPRPDANGYLGVDFEQAPLDDGTRRIASVVPGSPADQAGMRVGDVVVRIGKERLSAKTNLDKVTSGIIGKETPVTFRPRDAGGLGHERTVGLKPIGIVDLYRLKYADWVRTCERTVREATKGTVAYIHLDQMNGENLQRFQQAVARWNQNGKIKGMVLDVRNNGGGNIHNQLIAILTAEPLVRVQVRGGQKMDQPQLYWDRPVVLLINERSFSDAEVFPYMFKAAGIGKIVGVPTAGGVIGTNNITLSDGSMLRIPRVGYWTMDGKNLEGLGVTPHILVEMTAEDRIGNRDPQLAKAIEVIQQEIRAGAAPAKPVKPEPPKPPEPAPVPGPAPEASAAGRFDPLADAREGEWVRYRLTKAGDEGERIVRLTVTVADAQGVHFGLEFEQGDETLLLLPMDLPRGEFLELLQGFGRLVSHSFAEEQVGGAPSRVMRARLASSGDTQIDLAFSEAVPGYGLLRAEEAGVAVLEAIDWGRAPDAQPAAAEAPEVPVHPIHDAKVGEWVRYRRSGPGGQEIEMVLRVTEVTEDEVVMSQTLAVGEREIEGPALRRPRSRELVPPGDLQAERYERDTVTVGERALACIVMIGRDPGGAEMRWYVSPEVTVNGIVRVERDGVVILDLVAWGAE